MGKEFTFKGVWHPNLYLPSGFVPIANPTQKYGVLSDQKLPVTVKKNIHEENHGYEWWK